MAGATHQQGNHDAVGLAVAKAAPDTAILFGSRARGDHRPGSDMDLMVAANGNELIAMATPRNAAKAYFEAQPPRLGIDVVPMERESCQYAKRARNHVAGQAAREGITMEGEQLVPSSQHDDGYPASWPGVKERLQAAHWQLGTFNRIMEAGDFPREDYGLHEQQAVEAQSLAGAQPRRLMEYMTTEIHSTRLSPVPSIPVGTTVLLHLRGNEEAAMTDKIPTQKHIRDYTRAALEKGYLTDEEHTQISEWLPLHPDYESHWILCRHGKPNPQGTYGLCVFGDGQHWLTSYYQLKSSREAYDLRCLETACRNAIRPSRDRFLAGNPLGLIADHANPGGFKAILDEFMIEHGKPPTEYMPDYGHVLNHADATKFREFHDARVVWLLLSPEEHRRLTRERTAL